MPAVSGRRIGRVAALADLETAEVPCHPIAALAVEVAEFLLAEARRLGADLDHRRGRAWHPIRRHDAVSIPDSAAQVELPDLEQITRAQEGASPQMTLVGRHQVPM